MEAHELAEKFRNAKQTREGFEEIVAWCNENAGSLDLTNRDHQYLYEMATRYLMKIKIGHWNKDDANVVINYLAKREAWKLGIDENITVSILEEADYKEKHGGSSIAACVNNGDDTFNVSYSPAVVNALLSNNYDRFLRGMQNIFHEVVHAQQNSGIQRTNIKGVEIPQTKTIYIMALETIARKYNPEFYKENYSHLIKENHAEKFGLIYAMETIRKYNPSFYQAYNQEKVAQKISEYDRNFYEGKMVLNGKTFDSMLEIDTLCCAYISQAPDILKKYPVLQVGYNMDGTKKV